MARVIDPGQTGRVERDYEFTVVGQDPRGASLDVADDVAQSLFEHGCDDATVSFQNGVFIVDFQRSASNFVHAIVSAIDNVQAAGLRVLHLEPDEIVSAAEIARRFSVSRQAVHKWFRTYDAPPAPVYAASTGNPMYDWLEIMKWLRHNRMERASRRRIVEGRVVKMFNQNLDDRTPRQIRLGQRIGYVGGVRRVDAG